MREEDVVLRALAILEDIDSAIVSLHDPSHYENMIWINVYASKVGAGGGNEAHARRAAEQAVTDYRGRKV